MRRADAHRLGVAVQICTVRYIGRFLQTASQPLMQSESGPAQSRHLRLRGGPLGQDSGAHHQSPPHAVCGPGQASRWP
ncbi:DUF4158 domain-containing protein [Streptomyces sp. NBC_00576]|uniref:DUF4158 domain-containing protein n=1 Tax=Streptomyces sp. NBC_00576 TaxID=2903665 RepID=UPI003FCED10A